MTTKPLRKNDIQELTDIDHVLHRPTIYIGSTTEEIIPTFIYQDNKIVQKDLKQIPGLCKIVDEIIDNAVDEAIRTKFKYATKIRVSFEDGVITVDDDGRGLPIELNDSGVWTPETIYTKLRAGSNFNDEKRDTIGMNGVGSSLTTIFSKVFEISTANGHLQYDQKIENSLQKIHKGKTKPSTKNFTWVRFLPNYDYFKASKETISNLPLLIEKRLRNLAFAFPEINFYFNGNKIAGSNLKAYLKQIHEIYEMNETDNGRVGLFYSEDDFQQISFVNGLETRRGGTHVDYVTGKIVEHLRVYFKKKFKFEVKPADIKNKLFLMFSMRMTNAQFDGQTKERLMNSITEFRESLDELVTTKFLNGICKNPEIVDPIIEAHKLKVQAKENTELKKLGKAGKKVKVEKYHEATKNLKYLMLCEGDSASNGLKSVLGRENFSFYALKGKPLNTFEAPVAKITSNDEIRDLVKILNMNLVRDVQEDLTHDFCVFATDADLDGSHIRGLLIAFFARFGVSLIKRNRIKIFRTPIVTGSKNDKIQKYFFSIAEYNDYLKKNPNDNLKWFYYKGLSSWDQDDLRGLIQKEGLDHFIVNLEWDETTSSRVANWFGKEFADARKEFIRDREFNVEKV